VDQLVGAVLLNSLLVLAQAKGVVAIAVDSSSNNSSSEEPVGKDARSEQEVRSPTLAVTGRESGSLTQRDATRGGGGATEGKCRPPSLLAVVEPAALD
jgi:hypothetical protein